MSTGQSEPDFVPLPKKLKLGQAVDAPTKKHNSQARIKLDAPQKVEVIPDAVDQLEKEEKKKKLDVDVPKKDSKKRKVRYDELGEIPEGDGSSWFSGATKWFIIFLVCMFGSMLFVWYIGGPDEGEIDHLDTQYSILGLDPSATDAEVKTTFKKLAIKYHPDKCREADCSDKFVLIEKAKEAILKYGAYFRARRVVSPHSSL